MVPRRVDLEKALCSVPEGSTYAGEGVCRAERRGVLRQESQIAVPFGFYEGRRLWRRHEVLQQQDGVRAGAVTALAPDAREVVLQAHCPTQVTQQALEAELL